MNVTLKDIRSHEPCKPGWKRLLNYVGKKRADKKPLPLVTILKSNGLDDALWCTRALVGHDRELRVYAVWCARRVQHLVTDPRVGAVLDAAERFANGLASREALDEALTAARYGRHEQCDIGDEEVWDAVWDAASWTALGYAGDAAWAAAGAARCAARGEGAAQEAQFRAVFGSYQ